MYVYIYIYVYTCISLCVCVCVCVCVCLWVVAFDDFMIVFVGPAFVSSLACVEQLRVKLWRLSFPTPAGFLGWWLRLRLA